MRLFMTFSLLAFVAALLGGCGSVQIRAAVRDPGPPLARTAPLKGRAFVLGTVTVAPNVAPKDHAEIKTHCLPDPMYAAMLRQDLSIVFKNAKLAQGRLPAIPVNVAITYRYFVTNFAEGWNSSQLVTETHFSGMSVPLSIAGAMGPSKYRNSGPFWKYQRWTIPAMALKIATGIHNVQTGKQLRDSVPFTSMLSGSETIAWFLKSEFLIGKVNMYGVPHPMSTREFERATSKTAKQLAAICRARIAGG